MSITKVFTTFLNLAQAVEKVPQALRAVELLAQHLLNGESLRESLLKTAEIVAAEELLS